jgi:hypothetical protein
MGRRVSRTDGLRQLLIAEWAHRSKRWPPADGGEHEELKDLRAGRAVVVHSDTLLTVLLREGLPVDRYCYGGPDYEKLFVLDERDQLHDYVDE